MIHESSYVHKNAQIGENTRVWQFCNIMENVRIGDWCNIGQNVFLEKNVILGSHVTVKNNVSIYTGVVCEDNVFIGTDCVFTNVKNPRSFISKKHQFLSTIIRKGATLGSNSTILCGLEIGEYAMIGAGTVVTKNVPSHALYLGNPGKCVGFVCECGERLVSTKDGLICNTCGVSYDNVEGNILRRK